MSPPAKSVKEVSQEPKRFYGLRLTPTEATEAGKWCRDFYTMANPGWEENYPKEAALVKELGRAVGERPATDVVCDHCGCTYLLVEGGGNHGDTGRLFCPWCGRLEKEKKP